jgi:hypothetical protein
LSLSPKQYAALLNWCNRIRTGIELAPVDRLRRGKCQDAARCSLANTINYRVPTRKRVQVDETHVYRGEDPFEPDEVIAQTPLHVERFIRDFDRGDHQQLIGTGWS